MSKKQSNNAEKAIAALLFEGALPGETEGLDKAERGEIARFVAEAAAVRPPGKAVSAIATFADGERRRMRLAVINDDMPFLVDSIAATVAAHDVQIDRIIHPVIGVRRDAEGAIEAIDAAATPESMIYLELDRIDARDRRALLAEIERNLAHVRHAVADWPALQAALGADADAIEDDEGAALLRWFLDRNMTLLGHERWLRDGTTSDRLGIARATFDVPLLAPASRELAIEWFERGNAAPLLLKSNCIATVHRRVPLDLVLVPIREGGKVVGLSLHAGLWTSAALNAAPGDVPRLRANMAALSHKFGFDPKGHTGKAMAHALTALPNDLTAAFPVEAIEALALTAMSLADRPRPKLVLVKSALGRHLYAFVWMPRDEVSTGRREAIGAMLTEAANASLLNWSIELEDGEVALIRYMLDLRGEGRMPDAAALDRRLERMVRGWNPAVEAALTELAGARATRLTLRYAATFPANYRTTYGPDEAAHDTLRLAAIEDETQRQVRIIADDDPDDNFFRIKIYREGGTLPLSDAVPVLENFGFRVIEEVPTELIDETRPVIHDFLVETPGAPDAERNLDRPMVEDAIRAVLENRAENDAFNRLIVENGVAPRSVVLLRAWFRYLRQTGMAYGLQTVVDALRRAPKVATALIARFEAAHDPSRDRAKADAEVEKAAKAIDAGLEKVSAIDDDRILRALSGVVAATLRTNAFAPAANEALAFKLDSARVPGLPQPLPWREVFVYSPRVEGIHLRAGPVARGGLRWSDRRDDFRTEILGLMKAQRVKNAVIVPTGAKGGFYPKQLPSPANRDAWLAEGTESYRIFIRSLLSITDNIVEGAVVHPDQVVVHDGEDPYFVVAADKGTATFSDVANALAQERGFWLGDAFASGGSKGYDHKAMGITAKGAWVSVQRHFAEQGVDVQTDSIDVVGCGDMSGDVFGNGMLLSKAIRLKAAFDHRHIFLDPAPDPAASWDERDRLFALPRSSWADYDPALISKGGGVFARSEKTIKLTKQVREMLGVEDAQLEPSALIQAILKAPVDLIWFGGIGTYVKAASEGHSDVGDPANDRTRVNAEQLRARAIGEGANLGVTQAARIAFAARGGRINTDFIDNSAGVDCSDNEVNIKIALNREVTEGRLKLDKRDALLESMTDEVAHLVLEDNRLQTLALSFMESDGAVAVPSYLRVIEILEASGRLDRTVEGLGTNEDLLRLAQDGRGLTRPELAVLLATAKLALQDAIEDAPLATDPETEGDLMAAFPRPMQKKFADAIREHRLRGEIVATKLANRIVNRLGVLHPFELAEEEGAAMADIAAMFVVAERLFGLPALWEEIENAAIPEAARIALLDEVAVAARSQIADLLRTAPSGASPADVIARLKPGIDSLDKKTRELLLEEASAQSDRIAAKLEASGAPRALVKKVVRIFELDGAVGLADLGSRLGIEEAVLTRAFTRLGHALGLDWAQANAARVSSGDPWERLLIAGLARDFQQLRLDFLARHGNSDPQEAVERWLDANAPRVEQFAKLIQRARRAPTPNAAMLAQIAGQARVLLAR
ncbi:NAD-glutamate dehydrogenase [Sphingomonas baiyangensis]|uniref:NAD-glutamate dehydrogenase n=1 Tax=Sphingomonas baiyangensis TaxID=2572576 RepID=A0A4U1L7T6_9SPHN|nr:NAD-glutamate dehydrogenase domain-containing protein [Sphingomonas baiyangensis]TKD52814.1 NAD-glutamate dehydrogenase [Sphingomonas baiyangensis]